MTEASTLSKLRGFLLGIFALGCLGTDVELLLLEHIEDNWQWVPVLLLGAGLLLAAWNAVCAGRRSTRAFQGLMLLFLVSGAAGLWLHHDANVAFELELYPDLSGWELFMKAIRGTAPPALAPMAMALLGLIGLCWSYRHPALLARSPMTAGPMEPLK
jgi:hypothetical protein